MRSGLPVVGDVLLVLLSVSLFGGRISSVVDLSPYTVLAGLYKRRITPDINTQLG
jgi:hypothetical protein